MAATVVKKVLEVAWHRNGISGRGFYAVRFTCDIEGTSPEQAALWNIPASPPQPDANFLAVLTDTPGECYVVCTDHLAAHGVAFGKNSWRGDHYEGELRAAIEAADGRTSGAVRVGPFAVPTE